MSENRILIIFGALGRLGKKIDEHASLSYSKKILVDVEQTKNVWDYEKLKKYFLENQKSFKNKRPLDIIFAQRRAHSIQQSALEDGSEITAGLNDEISRSADFIKFLLEHCLLNPRSNIIIATSTNAFSISDQPFSYHLSKAGAQIFVKWFADRLLDRDISVKGVAFGLLEKENSAQDDEKNTLPHRANKSTITLLNLLRHLHMGENLPTYDEAARFVLFLLDRRAHLLTGQTLIFDGGYLLSDPFKIVSQLGIKKR